MSAFLRLHKVGIAVREVWKCIGFLPNYTMIDRSAFHFQTSERPVKINGAFGVALHDSDGSNVTIKSNPSQAKAKYNIHSCSSRLMHALTACTHEHAMQKCNRQTVTACLS